MASGILIRSGRSRNWSFCTVTLHDPTTDTTTCVIHGLDQREIEIFKHRLQVTLQSTNHPMVVTTVLTELMIDYFARLLEKRDKGLTMIESQTGMRHGFSEDIHRNGTKEERRAKRAGLDFGLKTQQLTGLRGTFAFCDLSLKLGLDSLETMETSSQALQKNANRLELPSPLCQRIKSLKALIAGAQSHRRLLQQRVEAQVQTVYSLVAQKDTAAMMTIAAHTRRDSIDMRIIAAVTLIFLPGTAIAVSDSLPLQSLLLIFLL
jgi:hypothetical protein